MEVSIIVIITIILSTNLANFLINSRCKKITCFDICQIDREVLQQPTEIITNTTI